MSLILPKTSQIEVVQDLSKFKWAGVPFQERFSPHSYDDAELMRKIHEYDDLLDIRYYYPMQCWSLIRFFNGRLFGKFVLVWNFEDRPDLGLRKELGDWIIDALKLGDTWGRAENRAEQVDASNAKVEADNAKNEAALASDVAKEMAKPMKQLLELGPDSDYKGVY